MTCPYGHDECEDFEPTRHTSGNLISCGKTYVCGSCGEVTPWEMGADDEMPDDCDDCWYAMLFVRAKVVEVMP